MARFGLPTVLGASAAGAYGMSQFKDSGLSGVWALLPNKSGTSPSGSSEVSALQNELRRLTGVVQQNMNQRPTVVTVGNGRSGWTVLVVPAVVGGTVLYIYCRITGTSVFDLFYVSRSSLTQFRNTVQEGITKLWEEMKKQKEEMFKVVSNLGHKQDKLQANQSELMQKQDQMDERLRRVDDTTYQLDSKANMTIHRVEKLDNRLQDVHSGVQAANQGIYMLVSAVSEVTQKIGLHNSRTAQALHRYVTSGPAWSSQSALPNGPGTDDLVSAASAPPPQIAQLPVPSAATALSGASFSGVSSSTGVATPGGLRGLMSNESARVPDAAAPASARGGTGTGYSRLHGTTFGLHSNGTNSLSGACVVEEIGEDAEGVSSGGAAHAAKPVAAGLGILRL